MVTKMMSTTLMKEVRHPQYDGFVLIMFGFLLMWPTLLTLIMFPILLFVYICLAKQEERLVRKEFGEVYDRYALETPSFLPRFGRPAIGHHG